MEDSLIFIPGFTAATQTKLKKLGIKYVQELAALDDYPIEFDFLQEDNPFEARYGSDWETIQTNKMTGMHDKVCVTDLVKHMHQTTQVTYKGTKYCKTTYLWSHDALSQLFDNIYFAHYNCRAN